MSHTVKLQNERVAHQSLERLIWPMGPLCPHCGETARLGRLNGLSTPIGAWKCYACRKPFTIRNGTLFHNSHVPLHVWLQALYLLVATRQKIGSQRLAQILGLSVRTAWQLKQKIMSGLDAAPLDVACTPWLMGGDVMLCDEPEAATDKGPGAATCVARSRRFRAALGERATAETDALFLQALLRLLALRGERLESASDDLGEVQLELGLLDDEPAEKRMGSSVYAGFRGEIPQSKG